MILPQVSHLLPLPLKQSVVGGEVLQLIIFYSVNLILVVDFHILKADCLINAIVSL